MTDSQTILDFLKANPGVKCSHHVQPAIHVYHFWGEGSQVELSKQVGALRPKLKKHSECMVYPVDLSPSEVLETA